MAEPRKKKWVNKEGLQSFAWEVTWIEAGKRQRRAGFKTKTEANAFLVDKRKSVKDGLSRSTKKGMTVAQLGEEFIEVQKGRVARNVIVERHLQNMEGHLQNYIAKGHYYKKMMNGAPVKAVGFDGGIGHMKLDQLRPADVELLTEALLQAGLNDRTVRAIKTTLHSMLDLARRRDYIAVNPADRIKVEVPRDQQSERVTPPTSVAIKSTRSAAPAPVKTLIDFSALTGLRAGELRALPYRNLDLEGMRVVVDRAVDDKGRVGPPKSRAGYRTIPISRQLAEMMSTHKSEAIRSRPNDLVFPRGESQFLTPTYLLRQLYQVFDELNWKVDGSETNEDCQRFVWHSLRHFAISTWIAAGFGLKAVQTYAGHADVRTTWNRYGHLFPDENASSKMEHASSFVFED